MALTNAKTTTAINDGGTSSQASKITSSWYNPKVSTTTSTTNNVSKVNKLAKATSNTSALAKAISEAAAKRNTTTTTTNNVISSAAERIAARNALQNATGTNNNTNAAAAKQNYASATNVINNASAGTNNPTITTNPVTGGSSGGGTASYSASTGLNASSPDWQQFLDALNGIRSDYNYDDMFTKYLSDYTAAQSDLTSQGNKYINQLMNSLGTENYNNLANLLSVLRKNRTSANTSNANQGMNAASNTQSVMSAMNTLSGSENTAATNANEQLLAAKLSLAAKRNDISNDIYGIKSSVDQGVTGAMGQYTYGKAAAEANASATKYAADIDKAIADLTAGSTNAYNNALADYYTNGGSTGTSDTLYAHDKYVTAAKGLGYDDTGAEVIAGLMDSGLEFTDAKAVYDDYLKSLATSTTKAVDVNGNDLSKSLMYGASTSGLNPSGYITTENNLTMATPSNIAEAYIALKNAKK